MFENPDKVMAAVAVISLVGGAAAAVVGWFLHAKDEAQQKDIKALSDALAKEKTQLELTHTRDIHQLEKELQRIQDSNRAAWSIIDRMKEERSKFWTRDEHERWRAEMRAEMKADMAELGNRLIAEIEKVSEKFSNEIRHVNEKIEK